MASSRRTVAIKAPRREPARPPVAPEPQDAMLLDRLLFFSDAVFAIVLTLLVLELRPPEFQSAAELHAALIGMSDHFVAFVLTFVVIGIFWGAHMNTLQALRQFDWPCAWMNLAFLFPICLLPFVTGLIAEARFGAQAWTIYSAVMIAASVANIALVLTIWRGDGRIVKAAVTGKRLYRVCRASTPGIAFAAGLVALGLGYLHLAQFSWLLIPLLFLVFGLLWAPKPASA